MFIRTYSELRTLRTFKERFEYLKLDGNVGEKTFGFDRYINQIFYNSIEWKAIRDKIIIRDNGCDLGIEDHEIFGGLLIHHMNPISKHDVETHSDILLNPKYLISTMPLTHKAIHYGNEDLLVKPFIERSQNDTCPWRNKLGGNYG